MKAKSLSLTSKWTINRKFKEDNIYIPSYINHRQHVHRTLY